jgi:RNA polymerase sigma factor (sigma-70 family)
VVAEDDHSQIEQLVRQYSRLIRSVAARVAGPRGRQVAEDVEQRVYLALWKQLERERNIEQPASYLYRSAVRETLRVMREERRHAAEPIEGDLVGSRAEGAGPLDGVERRELRERLARALGRLPPERRLAVEAHLAGFDVAEIMRMHGWPYQKARNLIARGMAELRLALGPETARG